MKGVKDAIKRNIQRTQTMLFQCILKTMGEKLKLKLKKSKLKSSTKKIK